MSDVVFDDANVGEPHPPSWTFKHKAKRIEAVYPGGGRAAVEFKTEADYLAAYTRITGHKAKE